MGDWTDTAGWRPIQDDDEDGATVFNDNGVLYITGGERSQEYLWMENRPAHLENKC